MSGRPVPFGDAATLPRPILIELGPDKVRQCSACGIWHMHGLIFSYYPPERPDVALFTRLCEPCSNLVEAGRGDHLLEAAADALRPFMWGEPHEWPRGHRP